MDANHALLQRQRFFRPGAALSFEKLLLSLFGRMALGANRFLVALIFEDDERLPQRTDQSTRSSAWAFLIT